MNAYACFHTSSWWMANNIFVFSLFIVIIFIIDVSEWISFFFPTKQKTWNKKKRFFAVCTKQQMMLLFCAESRNLTNKSFEISKICFFFEWKDLHFCGSDDPSLDLFSNWHIRLFQIWHFSVNEEWVWCTFQNVNCTTVNSRLIK